MLPSSHQGAVNREYSSILAGIVPPPPSYGCIGGSIPGQALIERTTRPCLPRKKGVKPRLAVFSNLWCHSILVTLVVTSQTSGGRHLTPSSSILNPNFNPTYAVISFTLSVSCLDRIGAHWIDELNSFRSPGHPVHRGYVQAIAALEGEFELTLVHLGPLRKDIDRSHFSEVHAFRTMSLSS